jgi:hypothetical protein
MGSMMRTYKQNDDSESPVQVMKPYEKSDESGLCSKKAKALGHISAIFARY